jgi:ElaB protein
MDNISSGTNKPSDTVTSIGRDLSKDTHGAIDRTADKAQPTADRLASSAHAAVDRIADKVQPTADKLASAAHSATDKIADKASKMGDALSTKGEKLSAAYKQYAEQGRTYVRNSPGLSVLVAMAAGYGLSKLLSSRK